MWTDPVGDRFLLEKPFKFLIGPEEVEISVHAGVLEDLSEPLHKMTTNGMKESEERVARLPETDVKTFLRVCEYAYSGSYHTEFISRPDVPVPAFELPLHGLKAFNCRFCWARITINSPSWGDNFPFCQQSHRRQALTLPTAHSACAKCGILIAPNTIYNDSMSKVCSACETELKAELVAAPADLSSEKSGPFRKLRILEGGNCIAMVPRWRKQAAPVTRDNGTCNTLCDHARLHVFADMQMISQLKQMSLCRLHRDLCDMEISEASVAGIIDLVVYTYENTTKEHSGDVASEVSLRALVSSYIVEHVRALMGYATFRDMINGGGEFVEDMISGLVDK